MYTVSDAFLQAVQNNTRNYYWTGTLTTTKGTTCEFGNKDILKGSGYITNRCSGDNEIELGSVYSAELGITLLSDIDRYSVYGAELRLLFHLELEDGTFETVPMGIFEVAEANRSARHLELKAYDYMLRFEKGFSAEVSSGTPFQLLTLASKACSVELAQTQEEIELLPNGKEPFGIYTSNDIETWRDLIYHMAKCMGCFATITRTGKLALRTFGAKSVFNVPDTQRFSSGFSDFKTRYTAVSSTNLRTKEVEYYALDPDDALTMELGESPLLQYGLEETRKRILETILQSVSVICYVPFDSETIGNPALDVGDVLTFSGGQADSTALTCITAYTYKINGKHSIKCVGKNPKLAAAKSKNDKNITSLLNQVESGKIIYYSFINAAPFSIKTTAQEVLSIEYVSASETSATFLASVLLETVPDTTGGELTIKAAYKNGDDEDKTFYPIETLSAGKHILNLFYPIQTVASNSARKFQVFLSAEGGTVKIGEGQIRATVSGQGLVSGITSWDGKIQITELFERLAVGTDFLYGVASFTESVQTEFILPHTAVASDTFSRLRFETQSFVVQALNENLSNTVIIRSYTMDTGSPGEYDHSVVLISSDAFLLKSDYSYLSTETQINYGKMNTLSIETVKYSRIDSLEVSVC